MPIFTTQLRREYLERERLPHCGERSADRQKVARGGNRSQIDSAIHPGLALIKYQHVTGL